MAYDHFKDGRNPNNPNTKFVRDYYNDTGNKAFGYDEFLRQTRCLRRCQVAANEQQKGAGKEANGSKLVELGINMLVAIKTKYLTNLRGELLSTAMPVKKTIYWYSNTEELEENDAISAMQYATAGLARQIQTKWELSTRVRATYRALLRSTYIFHNQNPNPTEGEVDEFSDKACRSRKTTTSIIWVRNRK